MPSALRRGAPYAIFAASILVSVLLGSSLTGLHTPFQTNATGTALLASDFAPSSAWRAIHVLSAGCQCSMGVAQHLLERGTIAGLYETVLFAAQNDGLSARLRAAGFRTVAVSGDRLEQKYGLAGAPWLLLVSPSGAIVYQGGYASDALARSGYRDVGLWERVTRGEHPEALPVFGCALSRRLQRASDPLLLKYSRN
jgi:hypothetical protein